MRLSTSSQAMALRSSLVPPASNLIWGALRSCSRCRSSDSSRFPVLAERACRALRSSTAALVRAQSPPFLQVDGRDHSRQLWPEPCRREAEAIAGRLRDGTGQGNQLAAPGESWHHAGPSVSREACLHERLTAGAPGSPLFAIEPGASRRRRLRVAVGQPMAL